MLKNLEIEDRLLGFSKIITRESISVPNRRFYYANLLLMSSYSFYQTPTLKNYIFTLRTQIFTQIYFSLPLSLLSSSIASRDPIFLKISLLKSLLLRRFRLISGSISPTPPLPSLPSHLRLLGTSLRPMRTQSSAPSIPSSVHGNLWRPHQLLCSLKLIQAFNKH